MITIGWNIFGTLVLLWCFILFLLLGYREIRKDVNVTKMKNGKLTPKDLIYIFLSLGSILIIVSFVFPLIIFSLWK